MYCCAVDRNASDSPIPPCPHPSEVYNQYDFEEEYLGGRQNVSGMMPDIAMATSTLAELHLFKRSTESLARQPPPPQRPSNFNF
ncbi:hypothetical protein HDE_13032 [Halotydeus destructor]|nr:hypothetical protein HDE_13032 [Halotydeus destructor]